MSGDEKRRDAREPVTLLVEYEGADDLVGDYTENLSTGGTFVATTRQLAVGTRIRLVLSFPGLVEPLAIAGTVRWTRDAGAGGDGGAGIEFDRAVDGLAAAIERIRRRDPCTIARLLRVLVVEDNPHVAALIEDGLRSQARRAGPRNISFAFRNAGDGRSAVELLRREAFDALIVDVYLPILDGNQVISQARGELRLTALPIIAVSAGGDAARRAALEAGADIFLDKPMRLRQVVETMQQLLHLEPT